MVFPPSIHSSSKAESDISEEKMVMREGERESGRTTFSERDALFPKLSSSVSKRGDDLGDLPLRRVVYSFLQ